MHDSLCDLCEHPAVIQETIARCGVVKVRRLCRGHGLTLWRDAVVPAVQHLAGIREKPPTKSPVTVPPSGFRQARHHRDAGE